MIQTALSPTRWSLTDLLPEPVEESLAAALAELEQLTAAFEVRRDQLNDDISAEAFMALLHDYETLMARAQRLGAYGALWFSAETQNPAALNLRDRVDVALTEIDNRLLFFNLWLKSMPDATAERLLPATGDLRYYVEVARKFRPHTLSEPEERIINLKDANGIDALVNLYDMITSRFTFSLELDGETKTLTRDQLSAYFRHASPDVRAAAYQELYRVYSDNSTLLAQMYNHRARDWRDEGKLRGFAQPIAARNLANDLPDAVVDTLLDVCARNSGLFQRYFRLKAGWIGMDKLRRYDIYAPLSVSTKEFPFGPAFETVLDSFQAFSSQLAEYAARVAAENHLDAEPRAGKRGGAFCYAVLPGLTPWVFMNYTGQARDVATLAHELGHAIHGMSAAHHSNLTFHSALPLAETASVFAEMLLTDRLLADERDPAVRRDLLAAALDDAYATVQRQASFSLFEREAHRLVAEGAPVDAICAAYMDNLRAQFGDAVELSDDFQWEWICVPHFYHVPFYTYAYSFGQLLVLSLYQAYRREGESFIPRYLKLLAYGGSEAPAVILQEAGFDITSADFWQGGYDVLSGMIDELERI